MLPFFVAAAVATAPLDRTHAAVFSVIENGDAAGCDAGDLRDAAAHADIMRLGRAGGSDVVVASVQKPCICGNANCPYYVIRLGPGRPHLLYSTYAIAMHRVPAAPLPTWSLPPTTACS